MAKKKKQRSARSYKLGAQKAAATRQKNKILKEIKLINSLPTEVIRGKRKGTIKVVVNYKGGKVELKTLQNDLTDKVIRINTDYINPLNKKLNRGKKPKKNKRLQRFQNAEGVETKYTHRAWQKQDFIDTVIPDSETINGLSIKKDLDKVQDLIDKMFENMQSNDIAGFSSDTEIGKTFIFVNDKDSIDESDLEFNE